MKTDRETLARITLSRHTLARYKAGGLPEHDRHMVSDEIAILWDIIKEHPQKTLTVGKLIERWERLLKGH